jgi:hypothetical protein
MWRESALLTSKRRNPGKKLGKLLAVLLYFNYVWMRTAVRSTVLLSINVSPTSQEKAFLFLFQFSRLTSLTHSLTLTLQPELRGLARLIITERLTTDLYALIAGALTANHLHSPPIALSATPFATRSPVQPTIKLAADLSANPAVMVACHEISTLSCSSSTVLSVLVVR